jgi:hypothetical protein
MLGIADTPEAPFPMPAEVSAKRKYFQPVTNSSQRLASGAAIALANLTEKYPIGGKT